MIKFHGVELTDIVPVKIEDIDVSPIQINPLARQRAIAWGNDFVRISGGTRTVTVSFSLLVSDINERAELLQALRDWCAVGAEYTLVLPQNENRYLQCAVTQMPDASYRKWWESKLKIVFTCFDNPYWNSSEQVDVACGAFFSVGGSAPPLMTIVRNGVTALTNQSYTSGGNTMTFTKIPAGSLVIDLNRQTAAIGSTSIMKYYTPLSSWIVPRIGANQIITGNGIVRYRERWV